MQTERDCTMKPILSLLIFAMFFSSCSCGGKDAAPADNGETADPYKKSEVALRMVHYNVGAFNKPGSSTLDMVGDMLDELHADIVSLNEVDSVTTRTGAVDQPKVLAERLGDWGHIFAEAMPYKGGGYGCSIVHSPALESLARYTLSIPKGDGSEPRTVGILEFAPFVFATTHLDHRNEEARLAGVSLIAGFMDEKFPDKPVIVCGDFNCEPGSKPIQAMKEAGYELLSPIRPTYSAKNPSKCIDYIFIKKHGHPVRVLQTAVPTCFVSGSVTYASDHIPVFVDIAFEPASPTL